MFTFALILLFGFKEPPPLEDVYQFPNMEAVSDALTENMQFQHWLMVKDALTPVPNFARIQREANQLYEIWATLGEALQPEQETDENGYWQGWRTPLYRRQKLAELLEMIGPDYYYTGRMPPHTPIWRLPRIQ